MGEGSNTTQWGGFLLFFLISVFYRGIAMAEVSPITDFYDVKAIYKKLNKWGNVREAECFMVGCHVGLRASDLLLITFDDVNSDKQEKKHSRG